MITDVLPAGVTFVSSPDCTHAARHRHLRRSATSPRASSARRPCASRSTPAAPSTITNTATVDSDVDDPDPSDNESSSSVVRRRLRRHLDRRRTPTVASAAPGDTITYTLTVRNDGPSTARDVSVSDTIPAGLELRLLDARRADLHGERRRTVTCDLGDIASGGTRTVTVRATVRPSPRPPTTSTSSASSGSSAT